MVLMGTQCLVRPIDKKPIIVEFVVSLPLSKSIATMEVEGASAETIRCLYVQERARKRSMNGTVIPVWMYNSERRLSSKDVSSMFFSIGKRSLTCLELLAFARHHSALAIVPGREYSLAIAPHITFEQSEEQPHTTALVLSESKHSGSIKKCISCCKQDGTFGSAVMYLCTEKNL
jgi:hypothetical protein